MLHLQTSGFSQAAASLQRQATARSPVRCCATAAAQTAPEASTSAPAQPATERRQVCWEQGCSNTAARWCCCCQTNLHKVGQLASICLRSAVTVCVLLAGYSLEGAIVCAGSVCYQAFSPQGASTWGTTWGPLRTGSSCRKNTVRASGTVQCTALHCWDNANCLSGPNVPQAAHMSLTQTATD